MQEALIVGQALVLVAVLWFAREHLRDIEKARQAERQEWFQERQVLLNRIKPETAQYVEVQASAQNPPPVSEFEDEDWWKNKEAELERLMVGS